MRVRRLTAIFWAICILACVFILYVMTDLTFKLPSIKPAMQELDDNKWSLFDSKLRHIETELNQHHAIVGEIKSAVNKFVENYESNKMPQKQSKENVKIKPKSVENVENNEIDIDFLKVKWDESSCPIEKDSVPETDIQMLKMYEALDFEDIDGGAWKQGWDIHYNKDQWSRAHKLKVFIVPHSHNDPGWIKTFENYYKSQTRAIFLNMVEKLGEKPGRRFVWAEISFLSLWWNTDATAREKTIFTDLVKSGQLEIVTGGWVMNDEANAHWLSIIQQLTTGHQWLIDNLDIIPKNTWAIDPFGYSSSQPYLSKLAGFDNSVIQRVHYRIKKELALNKQLEFRWRQLWDGKGATDMFTHMMPFYSYDVPHSCGPDPRICCQFDFKRLPGNGVSCPWGIPAKKITQKNIEERAYTILDQWRKKAQLYRSNVLMFPLGDDFRYDRATEWDNQFTNYEMLIDYINSKDEWNAEVQFGTLQDYFKALHNEIKSQNFPVLSGDFFTYADRNKHYWSGYYTSRPFYKNMDRVLLAYVRAAEIITAQATMSKSVSNLLSIQLRDRVEAARRYLSLFQHHDGVTGTSRDEVREDYAKKMHQAIKYSQSAIQQAAYHLLGKPKVLEKVEEDIYFDIDDIWRRHDEIPSKITIALDVLSPMKKIVLYNSLAFKRQEVVSVIVSSPYIEIFDPEGDQIISQVSPLPTSGEKTLTFAGNKYMVSFLATVDALALTVFTVSLRDSLSTNKYTKYAKVRVFNADYLNAELPKVFQLEHPPLGFDDINLTTGDSTTLIFDREGLIKTVKSGHKEYDISMEFVTYDSDTTTDNNSGAYLFIPKSPPEKLRTSPNPEMIAIEGPLKSSLYSALVDPNNAYILATTSIYNNPSLPQVEIEMSNTLQVQHEADNVEVAMKLVTNIRNDDTFYTDLNGMQMIKRKTFDKLPTQANFYPLPAATYIEDDHSRLTILTSTPLGMAAQQPGQIEIMQDRRLSRDDNRGMNQGVMDNVLTRHTFRIILEDSIASCKRVDKNHPSGQLSLGAHVSQQTLLHPLVSMQFVSHDESHVTFPGVDTLGADVVLASYRSHVNGKIKDSSTVAGFGMTFQRVYVDKCFGNPNIKKFYKLSNGLIKPSSITKQEHESTYESSLTHVHVRNLLPHGVLTLCPMEIRSVFIQHTYK